MTGVRPEEMVENYHFSYVRNNLPWNNPATAPALALWACMV